MQEHSETSNASNPSFGLCVLDASTAQFNLTTFKDDISRTKLETMLRQLRPKEVLHEKGNLSTITLRVMRSVLPQDCQWTPLKPETEFLSPEDALDAVKALLRTDKKAPTEDEEDDAEMADQTAVQLPAAIEQLKDNAQAMSALGGMVWHLKQLNLDSDLCAVGNFNIYDPIKFVLYMHSEAFELTA